MARAAGVVVPGMPHELSIVPPMPKKGLTMKDCRSRMWVMLTWVFLLGTLAGCVHSSDIRRSPAVVAAMKTARNVPAGRMMRTVFSAYDSADLIGLRGESYIIRLPDSAPESNRAYYGVQWFIGGEALGAPTYGPGYDPRYILRTRCWLVDVSIFSDPFSQEHPKPARWCLRVKALDGTRGWLASTGSIKPPPGAKVEPGADFALQFPLAQTQVRAGTDIPLACWYQTSPKVKLSRDLYSAARTSPLAYVITVRFQEKDPPAPAQPR